MAWDDGDKGNPWRSDKDKGPADLDAVVRDFQRKLAGLFRGGRGGGSRGGDPQLNSGLVITGVILLLAVWGFAGIYQVDEAERGVVLRFGAFRDLTYPLGVGSYDAYAIPRRGYVTKVDRDGETFWYLMPGKQAVVWGAVRMTRLIKTRNPQECWAALIHEDVAIPEHQDHVGPIKIELTAQGPAGN